MISNLRAFASKYKPSVLKLQIMDVFINLKDHYCKFLSLHKQYRTRLKRLPTSQPGSQVCYYAQRTPHQVYTANTHQVLTN